MDLGDQTPEMQVASTTVAFSPSDALARMFLRASAPPHHHVFLSFIRSPLLAQNVTTPPLENRVTQKRNQIAIQILRRQIIAKLRCTLDSLVRQFNHRIDETDIEFASVQKCAITRQVPQHDRTTKPFVCSAAALEPSLKTSIASGSRPSRFNPRPCHTMGTSV